MSEKHGGKHNHAPDNAESPSNLHTKAWDKGDTESKASTDTQPKTENHLKAQVEKAETWQGQI